MQRKHPKSGKPLVRIQPLQKELARAISHDVSIAQASCAVAVLPVQSEGTNVAVADTFARVGCAAVGVSCLPLAADHYLDESVEPDLDFAGSGFGWDDPDDF